MYYMANCTTSQAIIKQTGITEKEFEMQDIKFEKITAAQLDSYEENDRQLRGLV